MDIPLSNTDIINQLGGMTTVLRYQELSKLQNIETLLNKYGNAVILYPSKTENNGHWTGLFYSVNDKGQKVIEFFDPYGFEVDEEFNLTNIKRPHYLAKLLYKTKYPIEYNNFKFQKWAKSVNTCGRHVVNRILYSHLPLSQYNKLFGKSKGVDSDKLITLLIKK